MYVPMWVDDESLAQKLASDPAVVDTQQYYSQLDVVITGIGARKTGSSGLCDIFPESWQKNLFERYRCGSSALLVNSKGEILDSPMSRLRFVFQRTNCVTRKPVVGVAE
jgi:DNA-binding transcriptional regulator LsrR (DeoR family)